MNDQLEAATDNITSPRPNPTAPRQARPLVGDRSHLAGVDADQAIG